MPIRFPEPPPEAAPGADPVPVPPQPVFTVGLDDLLAPEPGAEAAESVSAPPTWRQSRFAPGGRAEVSEVGGEAEPGPVATGNDRFSPMIREALAIASEDPRVGDHDYEARLYRVPALSLLALWLHAESAFDLFVPIGRPVGELEPNRVYDDGEFMAGVRGAAERISALYDEADDADELGS
jgi:hypothetical protein